VIDHPYQLRRIVLKDFKSVDHASVELRPLTVVVGANSAGKSTLLQSILAVTQAVRSRATATEFPLNGDLIKLGTFVETRNFRSRRPDDTPMELAFNLVTRTELFDDNDEVDGMRHEQLRWHAYVAAPDQSHEVTGQTSGFARLSSLQIELSEVSGSTDDGDDENRAILSCDIDSFDEQGEAIAGMSIVSRRVQLLGGQGSLVAASGRISDRKEMITAPVDAVILAGGVPQLILKRAGQFKRLVDIWWDTTRVVVQEFLDGARHQVAEAGGSVEFPSIEAVDRAWEDLRLIAARPLATHDDSVKSQLFERLAGLDGETRRALAVSLTELGESRFRLQLRERFDGAEWLDKEVLVDHTGTAGEALFRASLLSRQFFASSVEYLGPLRAAPLVLYERGLASTKLGKAGEYTAAVLQSERNTKVLMPLPEGGTERRSLGEALDSWLQRFGLAESARSEDLARLGISLKVRPVGAGQDVDLTAVGVGVSQVLPVLVLCLLAEPGSLVLIEQPELHLHPRLQSELADFLLLCARSGRQVVVESHSEHLVNRLRYRIAEDDTNATHDLVRLVFAESEDGLTSYRPWEITPFGGLANDWPDGFLDRTAKEAQELVRRSLMKRKRARAADSAAAD